MIVEEHPTDAQLTAFGLGKLDDAEFTAIEAHVAECETCRHHLETQAADSFVALARAVRSDHTSADAGARPAAPFAPTCALTDSAVPASTEVPHELADHPRYRILGLIGVGGMGAVFKAEHLLMHRVVALKVINRRLVANPAMVERFTREVIAAGNLSHPNIVHYHDAEHIGDTHFLVMEHVEGTNLAKLMAETGPLPIAQACDFARQAALGLQHAFERGMVHRDIKPQNLMVSGDGRGARGEKSLVKILDFGLARLAQETAPTPVESVAETLADQGKDTPSGTLTQIGTVMGTPDYIAPEQARDAHVADIRSDIYSLGCTFYDLLTGQPPFPTGTVMQKVIAHLEQTPRPLTELRPDVPAELARVVEKMLAKDPAQRYQTPAEVAAALAPFVSEPEASAKVTPSLAHASGSDRRRWAWAAAGIVVCCLIASLFIPRVQDYAQTVIRIVMNRGVLEIDAEEEGLEVTVKGTGVDRKVVVKKGGKEIVELTAGQYEIEASEPGGLRFKAQKITLERGGRNLLTAKLLLQEETGYLRIINDLSEARRVRIDSNGKNVIDSREIDTRNNIFALPIAAGECVLWVTRGVPGPDNTRMFVHEAEHEIRVKPGKTVEVLLSTIVKPFFQPLFNGKDLTGWKLNPGKWTVKDGAIVADCAGDLVSERAMSKNYRLRMEIKLRRGAGIVRFRVPAAGERDWSVALMDNRLGKMDGMVHTGREIGQKSTGLVNSIAEMDEWMVLEIAAQDQEATVRINGKQVMYLHNAKYTPAPGHIGLRIVATAGPEDTEMLVRKIEIMELPSGPLPPEPAFQPLFNGKNLDGWVPRITAKDEGPFQLVRFTEWVAEKGMVLTPLAATGYLLTDQDYWDYELQLEYKLMDNKSPAGLELAVHKGWKDKLQKLGHEVLLQLDQAGKGKLVLEATGDESRSQSLDAPGKVSPLRFWNKLKIVSKGETVQVWLNDHFLGQMTNTGLKKGLIALKGNRNDIYFRNIEIRNLDAAPRLPPTAPGFQALFNGNDLTGWSPSTPQAWTVSDGVLTGRDGVLRSDASFQNFEMRAEIRLKFPGTADFCFRSNQGGWGYAPLGNQGISECTGALAYRPKSGKSKVLVDYKNAVVSGDEWFILEVRVVNKQATVRVNGAVTAEKDIPDLAARGRLEWHVDPKSKLEVRKVEVKELRPSPPEPAFQPLFNGKDLAGWHVSDGHPGSWTVTDGILTGKLTDDKWLRTVLVSDRNDFVNYRARIEMKLNDGSTRVAIHGRAGSYTTNEMFLRFDQKKPAQSMGVTARRRDGKDVLERFDVDTDKLRDQWLTLEIIANEPEITYLINGKEVARVKDVRFQRGHLSLDVGVVLNAVLSVRKIEIMDLPPGPTPADKDLPPILINGPPRLRTTIDNKSKVLAMAFTGDGAAVIAAGDENLTLFDAVKGDVVYQEKLPNPVIGPLSMSKDGKTFALIHRQAVVVLGLPVGNVPRQTIPGNKNSAALSPDAKVLAYAADGQLWFHDRITGKTEGDTRYGTFLRMKFSPDGRFLVGYNGRELTILNAKTRELVAKEPIPSVGVKDIEKKEAFVPAGLIDVSNDSKFIVVTGAHEMKPAFLVFGLPQLKLMYAETNLPSAPTRPAFSPDGNYLAFGLLNGAVQIWDVAKKKRVASWTTSGASVRTQVAFAPDGKTLATANGNVIELWDLAPEPGFQPLFNGKDLTGWTGASDSYFVKKDGSLQANPVVNEYAMLHTIKSYENYELRMLCKVARAGEAFAKNRGGVALHVTHPEGLTNPAYGIGISLISGRDPDMKAYGRGDTGEVKSSQRTKGPIGAGEWNELRVICHGKKVTIYYNGEERWSCTLAPGSKGQIGLWSIDGETCFRDIEIKELPTTGPAFKTLFDGKDVSAWDMKLADNWRFEDNRLICRGNGGMLRPKKLDLREFHLRIEARHFGEGAYLRVGPQLFQTPDKKSVTAHQHVLLSPVLISPAGSIGMEFGDKGLTGGVAQKDRTKPGEWYTLDVIHEGRYVRTLINGEQAAEFVVTEPGALVGLGLLGFHVEDKNDELQIRKIEIRDLPVDPKTAAKRLQGFWTPAQAIRGAVGKDAALSKDDLKAFALEFDKDKLKCGLLPEATFQVRGPNHITIRYRGPAQQMVNTKATYRVTHDILTLDFEDIDLPVGPATAKDKDGRKPLQLALFRYHAELVPLFNGKNLHGFVNDRERWTWQDDTLVGARRANDTDDDLLFRPSMPNLRDFELEFQVRTQGQASAGILFRGGENKENVGLLDNGPMLSLGGVTPGGLWNRKVDQLWKFPPAEKIKAVKPDDFNHYVLRCVGKRVTVQINGVTMIDDDLDAAKMQPAGKLAWALLDNGKAGTVTFRAIRLRNLPSP